MKKIIIFPGQGFQNKEMLTTEVQEFCLKNNLGDLLNEVLKDERKLFDTKYAQPLIIATQLVEASKYKELQEKDTEYIYAGFSLGEITALIASGAISVKEGLNFVRQRGEIAKEFSERDLQANRENNEVKRTFGVARIPYYEGLEKKLSDFNNTQDTFDRIGITNYIPGDKDNFVTITGDINTLKENIELFGGRKDQTIASMQCPFHTDMLLGLIPNQKDKFEKCISNINTKDLENVYSTRTCEFYSVDDTTENINNSLGKYLIQPMQHAKTLDFFNKNYPDSEIVVSMGEKFSKQIGKQYASVGGDASKVKFIQNVIKDLSEKNKEQNDEVRQ